MIKSSWKLLVMALGLTLMTAAAWAENDAKATRSGHQLSGTWVIQGQPEPTCGVTDFVNFASIGRDGRIVNVDPEVGTGVGEAHRIGSVRFTTVFFGFIPEAGLSYEVQSTLELVDTAHFAGEFHAILLDANGVEVCSYGGTMEGSRL